MLQLSSIIGPDSTHLLLWQELIRAVIVFAVGLGFLRASGLLGAFRMTASKIGPAASG